MRQKFSVEISERVVKAMEGVPLLHVMMAAAAVLISEGVLEEEGDIGEDEYKVIVTWIEGLDDASLSKLRQRAKEIKVAGDDGLPATIQ
jgi:hypothetical protein